ncbi:MAG TPA: Type 1 glutamine amidotransferase-like domain-containing protein [Candidatus Nanoarchaeia archaeon]|nr:Type 1 glutamine amidotransferase-like domain-containing protein [Candidatus Nanoarchaeia archaeon]
MQKKVDELGGVWVSGGNTFVLRQAMKLCGFDEILKRLVARDDFLYGAYSAGVCVLSHNLKSYAITDDATDTPYDELKIVLWEGIGLIDYIVEPHYDSDHPESKSTDKEIQYCIENKILFKALRDGEVIIIE